MAQLKTRSTSRSGTPAVLGASVRVRGRVAGDGDLTILGTVEGAVGVNGKLIVGEGGSVTADEVTADDVTVEGSIDGNVVATGAVHLSATAKVRGDLKGASISLDEGAELAGRIDADFELPAELGGKSGRR
ncbi:hypothetical protein BH09MYX1_BH09MYX1_36040 [soil metagenome]